MYKETERKNGWLVDGKWRQWGGFSYCDCAHQLHVKWCKPRKWISRFFVLMVTSLLVYICKIKVITRVDSSPSSTERLRLIPVSFRKIIDSRELTINLRLEVFLAPCTRFTWSTEWFLNFIATGFQARKCLAIFSLRLWLWKGLL